MNFALAVAKLDQFYNWDNLESLKTYYILSFFFLYFKMVSGAPGPHQTSSLQRAFLTFDWVCSGGSRHLVHLGSQAVRMDSGPVVHGFVRNEAHD